MCSTLQVDLGQLELGGELGRGAFGVVVAAKYFGEEVAVKRFLGDQAEALLAEADSLRKLRHKYIVGIRAICTDPTARDAAGQEVGLALVMELARRGSLLDLMQDPAGRRELRGRRRWLLFLSQAAHGIFYLHSHSILHRDIKAGNLLVTEQLQPLVADFGLACCAGGGELSQGTPAYMAPELLEGGEATRETDAYAFGLVMWFMACAAEVQRQPAVEPWDEQLFEDVMQRVLEGRRPSWPDDIRELNSLQRFRQVLLPPCSRAWRTGMTTLNYFKFHHKRVFLI